MLQSSLLPGLFFHLYSCAQVTRLPVKNRTVSRAERQKLSRTSTRTPSTSKIRIWGAGASRLRLGEVGKGRSSHWKQSVASERGSVKWRAGRADGEIDAVCGRSVPPSPLFFGSVHSKGVAARLSA